MADCGKHFDVTILYDDSAGPLKLPEDAVVSGHFSFNWDRIYSRDYAIEFYRTKQHHWLGHMVYAWLDFYLENPDYEYYWVMEYDVRFTGNWNEMFGHFDKSLADLLGTTMQRLPDMPDWYWWSSLKTPWGGALDGHEYVRGFFPFVRLSNRALKVLDEKYRAGWCGHFEVTIPTILDYFGLELEDFGGDGEFVASGNTDRFYTNNPHNPDLTPGTFVFRPSMNVPGDEKNKLWHPIKPAHKTYT
jgi:hypothetical protein